MLLVLQFFAFGTICFMHQKLEVDEKAMIRNRYNRIPHPAIDTK